MVHTCSPPGTARPAFPLLRLMAFLCLLAVLLAGCSGDSSGTDKKKEARKRPAIPVTTALAGKKTLPVVITATGHVESFATVEVRSQVTGILKAVHFKEGGQIHKGDLLYTIDPRPFEANLAKAEAALTKDRAELNNARRELERYALAARKGFVSTEQADQAETKVASLSASLKADQAAVDAARLELEYCSIRSPIDGRAGEIALDQGNVIKANADSPLVIIKQMVPVLISFTVSGKQLQEINTYQATGALQVQTSDPLGGSAPLTGSLVFIDNTVDPTTGVVRLKAAFENRERGLWPGQMAEVSMQLTSRTDCIVIPSQAVQIGQNEAYVYVVKDDQNVAYRPVQTGMVHLEETVITSGINEGEKVVTDGQMQLADGVSIQERNRPTPGSTADAKDPAVTSGDSNRGKR